MKLSSRNKKALLLVFLSLFIEGAMMMIMPATKDMLFSHYGITIAQMGILFTLRSLSSVILLLITGALSDKFGRKPTYLIGMLMFVGYNLVVPSFSMFGSAISAALLYGAAFAFCDPSAQSLLYDTMENPTRYMPYLQVAFATGGMVSPIIINILLKNDLSWKISHVIFGVFALALLIFAFTFDFPKRDLHKEGHKRAQVFKTEPNIFPDGMFLFLIVLFSASIQSIITTWGDMYAQEYFSVSVEDSILVIAFFQVGCIIGALLMPRILKKTHVSKVILWCTIGSFAAIIIALLVKNYRLFSILLPLTGVASSSILSMCIGHASTLFYKKSGAATAAIGLSNALCYVVCSYVSGLYIDTVGARNIFLALLVTSGIALVLAIFMEKRHKQISYD